MLYDVGDKVEFKAMLPGGSVRREILTVLEPGEEETGLFRKSHCYTLTGCGVGVGIIVFNRLGVCLGPEANGFVSARIMAQKYVGLGASC